MRTLYVQALTGTRLSAHLPDVARLRIEVFRAFPYLYDGDLAYEAQYLRALAASPHAVIVAAFDGGEVVGASTAGPLAAQTEDVVAPFRARGEDLSSYFYFGESVLKASYRGQGIGVRFFEEREAQARKCGASIAAFCAVMRAGDHPARPKEFVPLDAFWRKRGYAPVEGLICDMRWREVGDDDEKRHAMQFWTKRLR